MSIGNWKIIINNQNFSSTRFGFVVNKTFNTLAECVEHIKPSDDDVLPHRRITRMLMCGDVLLCVILRRDHVGYFVKQVEATMGGGEEFWDNLDHQVAMVEEQYRRSSLAFLQTSEDVAERQHLLDAWTVHVDDEYDDYEQITGDTNTENNDAMHATAST